MRHLSIRSILIFSLAWLAGTSVTAMAADALDQVVVTATRIEQPVEQIIGAVTVITRADIEHRQAQSLPELLRNETGLDLTSQGGLGKITAMFIRGTEGEHMLVLIDGVRAGSVTSGSMAFEFLPVDQIERIEIVRGPRSSLYGPDAIGGVIHVFTRKGGDRVSARIGGGTYDTFQASGSLHGTFDATAITASAAKQSSHGFNSCNGSATLFQGCFTDEPDRDGFSNRSGSLRINHHATFGEFEVGALFAEGHTEYDGSFQNETDFRQFSPHLLTTINASDNWRIAFAAGTSRDEQDYLHDGDFRSTYNTERRNASLQSDMTLPQNQLMTVGADFLDDSINSSNAFTVRSRDNAGVFGQYQVGIGAHRLTASARYDDNQQFGSHSTGNAGWRWQVKPRLYVMSGWGKAFRAPSFNDLYSPFGGDPNLLPERSTSYEVGVGGNVVTAWTWAVNAYRTTIEDLIELNSSFEPENTARAEIKGIEAETAITFGDTSIAANYSYVDPRNATQGANYDKILQRRARQSARLQIAQQLGALRLSSIVRAQGSRYNDAANTPTRRLGSYATVDVLGEYTFDAHWQFNAKVSNVLDKRYETVYWYNEPRRVFLVAVQYRAP